MTNSQQLAVVRGMLRDWYSARCGAPLEDVSEAILIHDGFYCGRKFGFKDHRAVWFFEEQELKIYSADGTFLESCSLEDASLPDAHETTTLKMSESKPAERHAADDSDSQGEPARRAA